MLEFIVGILMYIGMVGSKEDQHEGEYLEVNGKGNLSTHLHQLCICVTNFFLPGLLILS